MTVKKPRRSEPYYKDEEGTVKRLSDFKADAILEGATVIPIDGSKKLKIVKDGNFPSEKTLSVLTKV